jgi:hypothetical protein
MMTDDTDDTSRDFVRENAEFPRRMADRAREDLAKRYGRDVNGHLRRRCDLPHETWLRIFGRTN